MKMSDTGKTGKTEAAAGRAGERAAPLAPYRVLDLTRVRAGPTAVRQLADWGADVIKIEMPVAPGQETEMGGMVLGSDYQNLHRNKRAITLNLKVPEGRAALLRLVSTADVLIENFRPDVKQRLGIDYASLSKVNAGLVYASISGFGQDGPYAHRPGYDQVIQGMAGMMSVTGIAGHGPVRAGIAIADTASGLYAALGILTALLERERTGLGQWIQTSLLESMLAVMDFQSARWLVNGEVPVQAGNDHPTIIPTGVFDTQDGQITICVSGAVMWKRLCKALNRQEWLDDPRYATNTARSVNRDDLSDELGLIFAAHSSEHWIALMNAAGLACGSVNTVDQAFADPQVQHLGIAWPVKHPLLGDIALVGQPYRSSAYTPSVKTVAPTPGQSNREVLAEAGFSAAEIDDMKEKNVI